MLLTNINYPVDRDSLINWFHEILESSTVKTTNVAWLNTTYGTKNYS
jgi:hypothetical protein